MHVETHFINVNPNFGLKGKGYFILPLYWSLLEVLQIKIQKAESGIDEPS